MNKYGMFVKIHPFMKVPISLLYLLLVLHLMENKVISSVPVINENSNYI